MCLWCILTAFISYLMQMCPFQLHQLFDADVSIPVALVNKQDLFLFSCVRLHPQLAFSVQQHLPSHPPSLFPRPPFFLGIAHGFLLIPDRLSMVFLRVPFSRQPS